MRSRIEPVQKGEVITAELFNALLAEVRNLGRMTTGAGLNYREGEGGRQISLAVQPGRISLFALNSRHATYPGDGSDPDDYSAWRAKQVRYVAVPVIDEETGEPELDGEGNPVTEITYNDPEFNGATDYTHIVHDPMRVLATVSVAKYHPAFFNQATGHWEIMPGYAGAKWAKAKENWQNTNNPYVTCNPCTDYQGTDVDTATSIVIALPRVNGRGDPNVRTNNVIAYMPVGGTGTPTSATLLCVSNYLDDKLGTIKLFSGSLIFIPPGWALCDGTANSSSNGGSGNDLSGRFVVGYSATDPDYTTMWNSGGSKTHSHPSPGSHNHTIPYTTVGVTAGATNIASVSMVATGSTAIPATNTVDHRPPYFTLAYIERVL